MIVLPRLLNELLDQVDQHRAVHLALDFAEHVLGVCHASIDPSVMAACFECIAAAHEAIELGKTHPRLLQARQQVYKTAARSEDNRHFLADGAGLTLLAVNVGCQRTLEDAGAKVRVKYRPTCQVIARECQSEVGKWHAAQTAKKGDARQAARSARWEETRWQLLHVIATEPSPCHISIPQLKDEPSRRLPGRTVRHGADPVPWRAHGSQHAPR